MDENQLAEIQRSLGRIESAQTGFQAWADAHKIDDTRDFAEIRRNFASQDQRLATLEGLADTVESHGDALVSIETRVADSEKKAEIESATRARDRMWLRWIFGLVLALVGDHFTGSKLATWIGTVLK